MKKKDGKREYCIVNITGYGGAVNMIGGMAENVKVELAVVRVGKE